MVKEAFETYRRACYGASTLSAVQEREIHQAYVSGMLEMLDHAERISKDDDVASRTNNFAIVRGEIVGELQHYTKASTPWS